MGCKNPPCHSRTSWRFNCNYNSQDVQGGCAPEDVAGTALSYIYCCGFISNKLGLHARAAALFVQVANRFTADIFVKKNAQEVNGKSIMGVMMLAAACGSKIVINAKGRAAKDAIAGLEALIE